MTVGRALGMPRQTMSDDRYENSLQRLDLLIELQLLKFR